MIFKAGDVNKRNDHGVASLSVAARCGIVEAVSLPLAEGVGLNKLGKNSMLSSLARAGGRSRSSFCRAGKLVNLAELRDGVVSNGWGELVYSSHEGPRYKFDEHSKTMLHSAAADGATEVRKSFSWPLEEFREIK